MSHSSGIEVSKNLLDIFAEVSKDGGARLLKVQVVNETQLDVVKQVSGSDDFRNDFDLVSALLEEAAASYILVRTDKQNDQKTYLFYLLCYVPDKAPVRQKMLYASSRANLKSGLGTHHFIDDIFGSVKSDFDNKGFVAWEKHQSSSVPLTENEKLKEEELEYGLFTGGAGTSSAYAHGVNFPVDEEVNSAIDSLKNGEINYIQVGIDVAAEKVILKLTDTVEIEGVGALVPNDEPRFHFYKWSHTHDGEDADSLIYVYTSPDGSKGTKSAPVKLRMLYSTSKANVSQIFEARGLTIDAKFEIASGQEFNAEEFTSTLHPPKAEGKKGFSKPKPKAKRSLIKQ